MNKRKKLYFLCFGTILLYLNLLLVQHTNYVIVHFCVSAAIVILIFLVIFKDKTTGFWNFFLRLLIILLLFPLIEMEYRVITNGWSGKNLKVSDFIWMKWIFMIANNFISIVGSVLKNVGIAIADFIVLIFTKTVKFLKSVYQWIFGMFAFIFIIVFGNKFRK